MIEETSGLSAKSAAVLELIAQGHGYDQILAARPDCTYLDIFRAAREALGLLTLRSLTRVTDVRSTLSGQ